MKIIETIKNIWKIEDLRTKLGITLLFILIYRFGFFVCPFVPVGGFWCCVLPKHSLFWGGGGGGGGLLPVS